MSNATNPIETLHSAMAHAAYVAFSDYTYQDRDWIKYDKWRSEVFSKLSKEEQKALCEQERKTNISMAPDDCFVEKTRKHTDYDMTVAAMFVQTWGSTALGFGGIGGQAFTSAYVSVIESNLTGEHAVYFHRRLAYVINRPNENFWADVHGHRMVDANKGKAIYERTN